MTNRVEFTAGTSLESAHSVLEQKNCCEKLHGHSWTVTVRWAAYSPTDQGLFEHHLSNLENTVSDLDHGNLNDIEGVKKNMATAEAVAKLIFKRLSAINAGSCLVSVQVEEEPDCSISYFGNIEKK
jgi:6-pyruvoyl-tetrahydropterin synthase